MSGSNGNGGHQAPWALPDDELVAGIFSAPAANGNAFMEAAAPSGPIARTPMLPAPSTPVYQQPQAVGLGVGAVPFGAMSPPEIAPSSSPRGLVRKASFGNPDIELSGHMLGMSTLVVGLATLIGYRYGGVWGGLSGSFFGGSALNAYRAAAFAWEGNQQSDHEAIVSGTYAVLAAGIGGYLAYRTYASGEPVRNPPQDREQSRENSRRSCGIRPVY